MDLISKQTIEINTLALDGLAARHKALSANIANADTPGYQRTDITFEGQLAQIVSVENSKQQEKEANSAGLTYSPNSIGQIASSENLGSLLSRANASYNMFNDSASYSSFNPEISNTNDPPVKTDGNNVNIEYEMAELAKNGTKYTAITTLQEEAFRGLQDIIKGAGN
jgi:flagellar basal-body rod protein FlgB